MATKKQTEKAVKEVAVMIGNSRNGLWFGYATDTSGSTVVLKRARQIVYWSADCKGAGGLAANGPTEGCRITAAVPEVHVRDVTTVGVLSPEATAKFEAAPWRS